MFLDLVSFAFSSSNRLKGPDTNKCTAKPWQHEASAVPTPLEHYQAIPMILVTLNCSDDSIVRHLYQFYKGSLSYLTLEQLFIGKWSPLNISRLQILKVTIPSFYIPPNVCNGLELFWEITCDATATPFYLIWILIEKCLQCSVFENIWHFFMQTKVNTGIVVFEAKDP